MGIPPSSERVCVQCCVCGEPSQSGYRFMDSCDVAFDAYGWYRAFILEFLYITFISVQWTNILTLWRNQYLCECIVAILVVDGVSCALPRSVSSLFVHFRVRSSSSPRFD